MSTQPTPPKNDIDIHGNLTGSVAGGGTLHAGNIAGRDVNVNINFTPADIAQIIAELGSVDICVRFTSI